MKHTLLFFIFLISLFSVFSQTTNANGLTFEQEKAKLNVFLALTDDANGISNFEKLGYQDVNEFWSSLDDGYIILSNDGEHIKEMYLSDYDLHGRLDIADFTGLTYLYCHSNSLTELDLTGCTGLIDLECSFNSLTELYLTGCTSLTYLKFSTNSLTELDLSGCASLTNLYCDHNTLTELDLSGCASLTGLYCDNNTLTKLDLKGCTGLKNISCSYNSLTELKLIECAELKELNCLSNFLTELDLTGYTELNRLDCSSNSLTELNLKGCTGLTNLNCYFNSLIELDLTECAGLTYLECYMNSFMKLDLTGCLDLFYLDVSSNSLTELDLTDHTQLTSLYCENNKLSDLTFKLPDSWEERFTVFYCYDNEWSADFVKALNELRQEDGEFFIYYMPQEHTTLHTVTLELGGKIACNFIPGELTVEEGDHLYLQFWTDDPGLTTNDVIFLVDGKETSCKSFERGSFSYILNDIRGDHTVCFALRQYPVTLPAIDGATLSPSPGTHMIGYGESFVFMLGLHPTQDPEGILVLANDEPLAADTLNGFTYTLPRITGPVAITIDGVEPTGNLYAGKAQVMITIENGKLKVESEQPVDMAVYTVTGKSFVRLRAFSGSKIIALPSGIYIVRAGEMVEKVIIP